MRRVFATVMLMAASPAAAQDFQAPPPDLSGYMTTDSANATIGSLTAHDNALEARSAQLLNDVTLSQTATLAIALGPKQITVATNCLPDDRLLMTPVNAMPAGYMLGDMRCTAAGSAVATLYTPALALGASYSITVHVTAFRSLS